MFNLYTRLVDNPGTYQQLACGESLFTIFNCRLQNKVEPLWSHHNYIIYVAEGRKVWHTSHGSFDLREGNCVFVRKGAAIVEQFFDTEVCIFLFFVPDEFICDVLKTKSRPINKSLNNYAPIISINNSTAVHGFFQSMVPYFDDDRQHDNSLIELKFRELILIMADNPTNHDLLSYFCSLLKEPQYVSMQRVMEENFCFNLKMDEFAKLNSRSLSAFKRDFEKSFNTSPGKWLLEKRLHHAKHLLSNMGKTVSEASFESGFESPSHFSRSFRVRFGISPTSVKQLANV